MAADHDLFLWAGDHRYDGGSLGQLADQAGEDLSRLKDFSNYQKRKTGHEGQPNPLFLEQEQHSRTDRKEP
jgi:hypothetical protein